MIVEAASARDLACGLKAIAARFARGVNRVFRRAGRVLADRCHVHVLRTPREVRNAIAYVLLNARRHLAKRGRALPADARDRSCIVGTVVLGLAHRGARAPRSASRGGASHLVARPRLAPAGTDRQRGDSRGRLAHGRLRRKEIENGGRLKRARTEPESEPNTTRTGPSRASVTPLLPSKPLPAKLKRHPHTVIEQSADVSGSRPAAKSPRILHANVRTSARTDAPCSPACERMPGSRWSAPGVTR